MSSTDAQNLGTALRKVIQWGTRSCKLRGSGRSDNVINRQGDQNELLRFLRGRDYFWTFFFLVKNRTRKNCMEEAHQSWILKGSLIPSRKEKPRAWREGRHSAKGKSPEEWVAFRNYAQFRNGNQRKYAKEYRVSDLARNMERRARQVSKYCPLGPGQGALHLLFYLIPTVVL